MSMSGDSHQLISQCQPGSLGGNEYQHSESIGRRSQNLYRIRGIDHALGYAALANGSIDLKDAYSTDAKIDPRWALQSMAAGYRGGMPGGVYEVVVDDEELSVVVDGDTARVEYATSATPLLTVRCDARQFFTIARDPTKVSASRPGLAIEGSVARAKALFASMPLKVGSGS
jgi:hypothetical protein